MNNDVPDVALSWHAVDRFRCRWRLELRHRDAARELYYAVARAKRVGAVKGGVLYETDDLERIPMVIREHKSFGRLVVTVLPAEARSCTEDELEEFAALGRLATPEQPVQKGKTRPATILRAELTAEETMELARIERETAIAIEETARLRSVQQPGVVSALQDRIEELETRLAVASYERGDVAGAPDVAPNLIITQLVAARKADKARHHNAMELQRVKGEQTAQALRTSISAMIAVIDGAPSFDAAEAHVLNALDAIRALNEFFLTPMFYAYTPPKDGAVT